VLALQLELYQSKRASSVEMILRVEKMHGKQVAELHLKSQVSKRSDYINNIDGFLGQIIFHVNLLLLIFDFKL
jgi:hypothetical protein